jgi:hypothetical protein
VYLSLLFCSYFVVLCLFIFVCTSVGLLPPGESPIAVSNDDDDDEDAENLRRRRRQQQQKQQQQQRISTYSHFTPIQ